MTEEMSISMATCALNNVRCRMQFAECWDEGVRNVAEAIKAAVDDAEANALSFKPSMVEYVAMF